MAARRGGRQRAPKQDVFREALTRALADALDVDVERLEVTVSLDGGQVGVDRLPLELELEEGDAEAAPTTEEDVAADVEPEPEPEPAAASRGGEGARDTEGDTAPRDRAPRASSDAPAIDPAELDEEAEAAADLLEGLLDAMDLPGDLRISIQDAHAEVEVVGLEEGVLIGRRGQTLDAVQELVRTAMQRRFERRSRVLVDVDGYRARRLEKLLERADEAVADVLESGEPQRLEPMDAIERRLVHQRVSETQGVTSTSHGREPARRIVIELADD